MSTVVGRLLEQMTPRVGVSSCWMFRIAQSVFVPPTSTPIRNILKEWGRDLENDNDKS
jgi:hypothetical protein